MNVQLKKQQTHNITFATKLKDVICSTNSLSYTEKAKLFERIVEICREHVGDCADAVIMAYFIAIHDKFGFGAKRISEIDEIVQPIIDETVDKYDIGTIYKLRRDLEERGIKYTLHAERMKK